MRLKNLNKRTCVAIKNNNEYFLLMDLLEKAGYKWSTGNRPTEFNSAPEVCVGGNVVLYPETKRIVLGYLTCGKPIKKVVKFEVGDNVVFRFSKRAIWNNAVIIDIRKTNGIKYYTLSSFARASKKYIEPFFEDEEKPDEVDWSKVEVDTPILVRNNEGDEWLKRHFAKFTYGNVYAWNCGTTSWSMGCEEGISFWKYAKLPGNVE